MWLFPAIKDVEKLGKKGQQVLVEPGFARNWLIPQLLAKYDVSAGHGERQPKTEFPGPKVSFWFLCCLKLTATNAPIEVILKDHMLGL